jgi:hypothetical protein
VREAEADVPHLFEPDMVSNVPSQNSELRTEPRPETHLNDNTETGDNTQISASSDEAEQTYSHQQVSKTMI